LDPAKPVTVYRRHLPHWRQAGAMYFVTFRLADSLPAPKLVELHAEKELWLRIRTERSHAEQDAFYVEQMKRIERWLDAGHGACLLRNDSSRQEVANSLMRFHGTRYTVGAFAVLPNHVHVAVRTHGKWALEVIDGAWKRNTARAVNREHGRRGALWQEESFDRIVRDTAHLRRVVRYILQNPAQAGGQGTAWLCPEWHEWFYGIPGCGTGESPVLQEEE
jgi:REP element-mobilizing transposase RayT